MMRTTWAITRTTWAIRRTPFANVLERSRALREALYDCRGVHDQFFANVFEFVIGFGAIVAGPQRADNLLARQVSGRRDSTYVFEGVGADAKETREEV